MYKALLNEYTLILVLRFIFRSIIMAILAGVTIVAIPIRHGPEAEVLADVGACVNDPTAARTMQYGAQLRAYVGCWLALLCVFQVAMHRLDVGGKGRRGMPYADSCSLVHYRLSD